MGLVILDFEDSLLISEDKISYIFSGIKTPGEKRNLGINYSKGEFIAFLDDDAYPSEKWLENAKKILDSHSNYTGVCGPSITPPDSSLLEEIGGYIYESFLTSGPTRYRHIPLATRLVDDYPSCNFTPSCSEYALKAIKKKGIFIGLFAAFDRLSRCNHPYADGYEMDIITHKLKDDL